MRKGFLLLAITLLFTGMGFAQGTLKIGYLDSQKLMSMMPESDSAQAQVKRYAQSLQAQMQAMGNEYKNKVQDYQNNQGTMSDLIRQTKEKEITDLQQRIQAFQGSADQDIQKKQQDLYQPIVEKVKNAIEAVGKEYHYTYILDVSQGTVLFYANGDDVLPLVKKKLGLK
ncbi:MAG: OmpH family outer membrane protein [Bacteroidales bacterium]|nr:OmpH family outer membrane protein [Bacteroidales bacterium]